LKQESEILGQGQPAAVLSLPAYCPEGNGPMKTTAQQDRKNAAVVSIAAFVLIFTYSFALSLPTTIINEIVDAFSLEGAGEGLMISLTNAGFLVSLFIIPMTQGRVRKITVLIAACALQGVMLLMIGVSAAFLMFSISCVILGFSEGFIDTCCNSVIVDVHKTEGARYLGYLHGFFGVGSLIAPLAVLWLLRFTDWRGVHFAIAALSVVAALFVLILTHGSGKSGAKTASHERTMNKDDLLGYLRDRRVRILAFAGVFSALAMSGVALWIVRYMAVRFDAPELGSLSFSAFWMCATANRFFLSQIVGRAPMKFFILGAVLCGVFVAVGVLSANPIVMCVMAGASGLACGHFVPVLVSESAAGYEGKTSLTTSFVMFIQGASRIAAPIIIAFASVKVSYEFGMMTTVVAAAAAAVCGRMALKTTGRTNQTSA